MPTITPKHHASKVYTVALALAVFVIIVVISLPTSQETKETNYEQPFVEVEEVVETQEEIPEPVKAKEPSSIKIDTFWGKFSEEDLRVETGTKVTWKHADNTQQHGDYKARKFLIACYIGPQRVIKSENFFPGESFSFTFTEEAEYLCVEAIYGARGFITVGNPKPREVTLYESVDDVLTKPNAITGGVIKVDSLRTPMSSSSSKLSFSADPIRRILFNPTGFSALAMLAIVFLIIATIEVFVHMD